MALDSYSPCPGGRDKKIRFCCPDLLKELQQIETMIQNGQPSAGLALIERLEKDRPDCACLTAAKCVMLRQSGRWEEFAETAEKFVEREPDNPQAIAESVLAKASIGETKDALSRLVDGLEKNEPGKIHPSLLLPMVMTASQLAEDGQIFQAIALLKLIQGFDPNNQDAARILSQIYARKDIPLVLKEISFDPVAPDDFPFKDRYHEAVLFLATGQWKKGRAALEELRGCEGQWPNLARSLALVNFWLGEDAAGCEALDRFAKSEKVSFDDATDAELLILFMKGTERADDVEVLHQVFPIGDQDRAMEALLSQPTVMNVPFDPRQYGDADHPAPNHIFRLIDKPFPADGEEWTLANTPTLLATILFYGKQTDRAARIETQCYSSNNERLLVALKEILGEDLGAKETEEPLARVPWIFHHLEREFQFKPTTRITSEKLIALYKDYRDQSFIPDWLSHPAPDLDGLTPEEFVQKNGATAKLAALIQLVGLQADPRLSDELVTQLRERLGVSGPAPIPLPETDEEGKKDEVALNFFKNLPIWRWFRVETGELSAKVAGQLLAIVRIFSEEKAMTKFADRILSFPPSKEDQDPRLLAYEVECDKATTDGKPEDALRLIDKAKAEAKEFGVSDSRFNLREASLQIAMGRPDEFRRVVEHIARDHREEQSTIQALQLMLMNLGILNPDGSPRATPAGMPGTDAMGGATRPTTMTDPLSGGPAPMEEPKRSSGLWTPGSDDTPSGGGSKLWTPE